jgi:signal transduction histidine kinase
MTVSEIASVFFATADGTNGSRHCLQTVLDTLPDGIVVADATRGGAIVAVNRAAGRLWGAPPLVVGDNGTASYLRPAGVRFTWPDGSPLALEELPLSRALRGETVHGVEIVIEQPSGKRVPAVASGVALYGPDGTVTGAVASFEDITPLKEAERLKREFLSLITHELRTPLTGIKGIVSGLLADDVTLAPAQQRELLTLVDGAADHLSALVTNLLDMSRLEAGALDLEPEVIAVTDLVAAATRDAASVLREHEVCLDLPARPMEVWADYVQTKRVLVNLLANAAKYAPAGSTITISVEDRSTSLACGAETQGEIVLAVRDEGSGISREDLPHVFDRFYRGSGKPVRGQAGSGLGLTIARGLVEAMGGRIWAQSQPNQGATFTFVLPRPIHPPHRLETAE